MNTIHSTTPSLEEVEWDNASKPAIEVALAAHPFLEGMSPQQRRMITDCAMLSHFEPGELIAREGDLANRFYVIIRGEVVLESFVKGYGAVHIQTIGADDILGWSWLFPPYYWQFDVRAIKPTDVVFLYGTRLRQECDADHSFGYELLKRTSEVIIKCLQDTRRQLVEATVAGQCSTDDPTVKAATPAKTP